MLAGEIDLCKDKIKESMKPILADSILDIKPILNSIIKFDSIVLNIFFLIIKKKLFNLFYLRIL